MAIGDWLGQRAALSPHKLALIDMAADKRPISYREWDAQVNRTARLLLRLGVGRGHRVAVLATNDVVYLDLWFACGKVGAVLQTLNWRLTPRELAALIADAAPVALAYGPDSTAQVETLRSEVAVEIFIALGPVARDAPDDIALSARDDEPATPPPDPELRWEDPWVIAYTGGTTGMPKGAVLTHGSIVWNAINTVSSWGLTSGDTAILNAPLFHTGGLNVLTAPLVHVGGTSIVCRQFDAGQVFDLIRDEPVTLYFGVPTMFIALQHHPRWPESDWSRLRLVISGGAPCPRPVFEAFWQRGVSFKTGYGLTEAGPNTFWLPDEDVRRKPGSVGVPLFHIDVAVVAPDGRRCAPDEVGELLVRGPHVCAGYWNRPEETAQVFGADGWLHTGDLARCDVEGYYWIVGRLKELIISGGENVYPAEVESVLAGHPGVAEAALIGVPDERWGEVGRAIIVCREGHTPTAEDLLAFCAEQLARYKIPRSIVFADALPKTGAGKVDRRTLSLCYAQG